MNGVGPSRRFLILHGLGNRRQQGHWQWWLTEELRRRGEQVLYPQFPNPDVPEPGSWSDLLSAEWSQLGERERVVVCHSFACALWYWAGKQRLLDGAADRLLLVAPPGPEVLRHPETAAFFDWPWQREVLTSSAGDIRLVASDVDPYCTEGSAADVYAKPLGLDTDVLVGAGHISTDDGYGPWPPVLDWCLDGATRLGPVDSKQA